MMVFDETTKSLFSSDLFIQPGEQPAIVRENPQRDVQMVP
jgi:flavorubredoxin